MAEKAEDEVKDDNKVDYEKIAKEEGWKSKEELGDEFDAARYVGAEEFVKRKPLFDTIKSQNKLIKELKQTVDGVVNFSQKNAELAAKKAISDLNTQKKEAIKMGEVETVEALDQSIRDHEKVIQDTTKPKETIPAEIIEWTAKNQWFDEDMEMQDFAVAYTASWTKRNPGKTLDDALKAAADAVKKAYPESKYFKTRRQDPPVVEGNNGEGKETDRGNKKYTMSRLTEEQRMTYAAYVIKNKMMTHDKFFQSLEEIGALEK